MAAKFWPVVAPKAASVSLSDLPCLDKSCKFPPALRLLKPAEFQAVFDNASFKVGESQFLLLVRHSGLGHPRLGLVIAKKKVKRAVDRNRIKRVVRDSFRRHQTVLPPLDVIFMARQDLGTIPGATLRAGLEQAWQRLRRKAETSRSAGSGAEK